MKKIKYRLQVGNEIIAEQETNCILKNDILTFKYEKSTIKILIKENIFIREAEDNIFKIENNNDSYEGSIYLKNQGLLFDVPIVNCEFTSTDTEVYIQYEITDDDTGLKKLTVFL